MAPGACDGGSEPQLLTPFPRAVRYCSKSRLPSRRGANFPEKVASRRDETTISASAPKVGLPSRRNASAGVGNRRGWQPEGLTTGGVGNRRGWQPEGPMGPWAHGPMGPWAHGPKGPWAHGPKIWKIENHKISFRLRKKSTELPEHADRSVSSRRYDSTDCCPWENSLLTQK